MAKLNNARPLIFRVVVPIPRNRFFDYRAPDDIDLNIVKPGLRLLVPFGKGNRIAYLVEICNESNRDLSTLKTITRIVDDKSLLNPKDMALLHWASRYYHHPLGEVINTAFPVQLRKGKPATINHEKFFMLTEAGQNIELDTLKRASKQITLLEKFRKLNQPITAAQLRAWDKYYTQPLQALLHKGLLKLCTMQHDLCEANIPKTTQHSHKPNRQQQAAIDRICTAFNKFSVFLLEGVTGSGKTEVYMQVISQVLTHGKQVIVLLPEITLTPQLETRFRARFSVPVAVFHSRLTNKERQHAWLKMQQGLCSILLGTRSALFTPIQNPGLIILDEEHDSSFKQQEGFRFSARDVAIVRAKQLKIPVLLGSATPSLESLYNASRQRYQLLHLSERAGTATEPELILLDIRNKKLQEGLSEPLLKAIKNTLDKNEQALIFLNRRGYAPTLICHACGWVAQCARCDTNLVIHQHEKLLRCHHCGKQQLLVDNCPSCRTQALTPLGLGTERVEQILSQLFPDETIMRLDRDTTQRKGVLEKMLTAIRQGKSRIILGTQMLAKGHDFPNVTLVALLDVDSGLFSIDYHAPEKLAQLIVQVAGRSGRAEKPGKVILQTRQPEHPLLTTLIQQGYNNFARLALAERKTAMLPPYSHQALLRASAVNQQAPLAFLDVIRTLLAKQNSGQTHVLGPVPAPMPRRAGRYRYQMLLQSNQRRHLHSLLDWIILEIENLKESKKIRWSLDVDPVDLY